MFGSGDEFTIVSYRIPWLVWIQLLVMVLLVVLLCCFSIITVDPSEETPTSAAAASASTSGLVCDDIQQIEKPAVKHDSVAAVIIGHRQNIQGAGNPNIKGEIASGASRRVVDAEEDAEEQGLSLAEEQGLSLYLHPCHYFNLAKLAFLKCLGLDPTSDTPPTQQHRKRKES